MTDQHGSGGRHLLPRSGDGPAFPVRRALLLLVIAVILLDLPGFGWGLPNTVAPHPDDVAKPALWAMQQFYLEPTKYPKVHHLTLGLAYTPYLGWLWLTGGLDLSNTTLSGADAGVLKDPLSSLTMIFLIARGVNIIFHAGTVLCLFSLLALITRNRAAAFLGAALYGFSPCAVLFSRMTNVDVPMVFWFTAALLAYFRFLDRPTRKGLVVFGLFAVLAVCTKEQITFVLVPMVLYAGWAALRHTPGGVKAGLAILWPAAVTGILLYALLQGIFWMPEEWYARLVDRRSSLSNFVETKWTVHEHRVGILALCRDLLIRYPYAAGLGGALLALSGVVLAMVRPSRRSFHLLLLLAAYFILTFWVIRFAQFRYLMPGVLLGAVLAGQQLGRLLDRHRERLAVRAIFAAVALAVLLNGAHAVLLDRALVLEPRVRLHAWLENHVRPGGAVEIYANENYFPPLRSLGLEPRRISDMTPEGFRERGPQVALLTDGYNWDLAPEEIDYTVWLGKSPEGYEAVLFGPLSEGRTTFFMAPETRDRIWPNFAVVFKKDSPALRF